MYIKMVNVYKVDFFNRIAYIKMYDEIKIYPIHFVTSSGEAEMKFKALLVGENQDSAIAIIVPLPEEGQAENKTITSLQNNLPF